MRVCPLPLTLALAARGMRFPQQQQQQQQRHVRAPANRWDLKIAVHVHPVREFSRQRMEAGYRIVRHTRSQFQTIVKPAASTASSEAAPAVTRSASERIEATIRRSDRAVSGNRPATRFVSQLATRRLGVVPASRMHLVKQGQVAASPISAAGLLNRRQRPRTEHVQPVRARLVDVRHVRRIENAAGRPLRMVITAAGPRTRTPSPRASAEVQQQHRAVASNGFESAAARNGTGNGGAAPPQVNVGQLTDEVLRQIDRRFLAARERMGKM
jgi:hypothetical protein